MNTKMGLGFVIVIHFSLIASGCETPLRAPLCQEGEFEFPPNAAGRYRLTTMRQSPSYSGAFAQFEDFEFEISEQNNHYELATFGPVKLPARIFGLKNNSTVHVQKALSDSKQSLDDSSPILDIGLPLSVCKIGGVYYAQNLNENSTYSISRLDVSPTGMTTTAIGWSPDSLKSIGVSYFAFPGFNQFADDGKMEFDQLSPVTIIAENSNIDEATRLKLLAVARPTFFGTVFSRLPEKALKRAVSRKLLLPKAR